MSKKNSIFAADLGAKALHTCVHTHVPFVHKYTVRSGDVKSGELGSTA